jgi:hypothetical protein
MTAAVTTWHPGVILPPEKLTPSIIAIKDALSVEQTVALTAWGEARSRLEPGKGWVSNPIQAMANIVNVIENRASAKEVVSRKQICLARRQFSCWDTLGGPENFYAVMERAQRLIALQPITDKLLDCLALANGTTIDSLQGATHYYAPLSMVPAGRVPMWARPPAVCVADEHGHKFYASVKW